MRSGKLQQAAMLQADYANESVNDARQWSVVAVCVCKCVCGVVDKGLIIIKCCLFSGARMGKEFS